MWRQTDQWYLACGNGLQQICGAPIGLIRLYEQAIGENVRQSFQILEKGSHLWALFEQNIVTAMLEEQHLPKNLEDFIKEEDKPPLRMHLKNCSTFILQHRPKHFRAFPCTNLRVGKWVPESVFMRFYATLQRGDPNGIRTRVDDPQFVRKIRASDETFRSSGRLPRVLSLR